MPEDFQIWSLFLLHYLALNFKVISESSYSLLPPFVFSKIESSHAKACITVCLHLKRNLRYILSPLLLQMRKKGPSMLRQMIHLKMLPIIFYLLHNISTSWCMKLNELKSYRMIYNSDNEKSQEIDNAEEFAEAKRIIKYNMWYLYIFSPSCCKIYTYLIQSYWAIDEHTYRMLQENVSSYTQSLNKNILNLYARTKALVYV